MGIGKLIWNGFWSGLGIELSFFFLWVGWHALHSKVAHKFDPEHIYHKLHKHFE